MTEGKDGNNNLIILVLGLTGLAFFAYLISRENKVEPQPQPLTQPQVITPIPILTPIIQTPTSDVHAELCQMQLQTQHIQEQLNMITVQHNQFQQQTQNMLNSIQQQAYQPSSQQQVDRPPVQQRQTKQLEPSNSVAERKQVSLSSPIDPKGTFLKWSGQKDEEKWASRTYRMQ